jgi:hypothetical protein
MLMLDAAIREHRHAPPDCVLKCVISSILRNEHCGLEGLEPFRSFLGHWMAETQEKFFFFFFRSSRGTGKKTLS